MDTNATATKMQIDPQKLELLRLRVLSDTSFRKQILDDPKGALSRLGIEQTKELMEAIEQLGKDLTTISTILGVGERECFS